MDVAAQVARYESVTQEQEAELVAGLIRAGWEAGCWIRPNPEQLLDATQPEIAELLERLGQRPNLRREVVDDPFVNGRDQEPIGGEEPCYIVLSQRCDIVGGLKTEPLIELAPASICSNDGRIKTAWKNSPREFPVDPHASPTHLVDLRYRYFISKLDLIELVPRQALPRDIPESQVRIRFGLRTAQRYTRAAVPDRLVESVVIPLTKLIARDAEANAMFTEWALFHGGRGDQSPGILAVYRSPNGERLTDIEEADLESKTREAAEDKFQAILEALPEPAKAQLDLDDDHRTRAVDERDLTVADWRLSWKLEWDAMSFNGDPDAAIPVR